MEMFCMAMDVTNNIKMINLRHHLQLLLLDNNIIIYRWPKINIYDFDLII